MSDQPDRTDGLIVLASASPRRRAALVWLGLTPEIAHSQIDEAIHPGERPAAAALRLAAEKATAVAPAWPDHFVIAADTMVISQDGEALGKPACPADARDMLARLRGRRHRVVTAQAIRYRDRLLLDHLSTLATMRDYSESEIERYIQSGDPFDKPGAYAIQHPIFRPVRFIDGCYLNVLGLPLCRTTQLLRKAGFPQPLPELRGPWCRLCRQAAAGALPGMDRGR